MLLGPATGCGGEPAVSRDLGARCERHADCRERCLRDSDTGGPYPDGFCTTSCDRDRDCPHGAVCAALEGGVCLFACDAPESCAFLGSGWSCMQSDGSGPFDGQADEPDGQAGEQPDGNPICLGQ